MADEELELDADEEGKGGKGKLIIIILAAVLLLGGGGVAAMYFMEMGPFAPDEEEVAEGEKGEGKKDGEGEGEGGEKAEGGEPELDESGQPIQATYHKIDPKIVVNWHGKSARYLQVTVEVMAMRASVIEDVTTHQPRIQNDLLMLLQEKEPDELRTRAGKTKLQQDVLELIQDILREETGKPGIEAVYFTSFVMQ